jgi:hypothetical protein
MKKLLVLFIIFIIVAFLVVFLQKPIVKQTPRVSPTTTPSPTPVISSLFQNISPGITTESELVKTLGVAISIITRGEKKIYKYPSIASNVMTNIDVNKGGVVEKMVEPLPPGIKFNNISAPLGQGDFELYGVLERSGFRLYVYLSRGVALLANPETQEVSERWKFQPTTASLFLQSLAPNMTTKPNPENQ